MTAALCTTNVAATLKTMSMRRCQKLIRNLLANSTDCRSRAHFHKILPAYSLATRHILPRTKKSYQCYAIGTTTLHRGLSTNTGMEHAIKDPFHPTLFYHLFPAENPPDSLFALSFLSERPVELRSRTILGWLPAASNEDESRLHEFEENGEFLNILHDAVKKGLIEDEVWRNAAVQAHSGWIHIFDQRNPPPLGRIPDPDDIIASIRVEDGKLITESYQAMPSYRLCTNDGVCQLTDGLMDRLKLVLSQVADAEQSSVSRT